MIRFRGDVEGLRAVAVLLVVLDHLDVPGFHGGFFGVDVFFVLSGYLITSLLAAEYAKKAEAHGSRGSI
jgi:peptidoglycan/LPS O-acetylase OafA/YrhL